MRPSAATMARRDQQFQQATSRHEVDALQRAWDAEDDAAARAASLQGQELTALRRRLGRLERSLAPGGNLSEALIDALAQVLRRAQDEMNEKLASRAAKIDLLTARVSDLEENRLRFMGTHEVGARYKAGSIVTRSGSLWHCHDETRTAPGTEEGARGWQLIVKSGQPR